MTKLVVAFCNFTKAPKRNRMTICVCKRELIISNKIKTNHFTQLSQTSFHGFTLENMTVKFKWDLLDEIAMVQVFLSVFQFSIVSITPPKPHNHLYLNPYPTAFPYGNGMVLHFYQQQESSTTKTVHKVINKGLKAYV